MPRGREMEVSVGVRASDFAVRVSRLPQHYTDPHAVKARGAFCSLLLPSPLLPLR